MRTTCSPEHTSWLWVHPGSQSRKPNQEVAISKQSPHTFTLVRGSKSETVEGRGKAVNEAKRMSERFHGPVRVERDDSRVEMTFRRGSVSKYRYTTHGR